MRLQQEVYEAYKNHITSFPEENRKGAMAMKEDLIHSPLYWNGTVDKTVHIPKVYDQETIEDFRRIVKTAHGIFVKVIREYRDHEDYRRLFSFPKELEDLILLPVPYDSLLPIARFDLFYHEDTGKFHFCEINTDGTAAMMRDLIMSKALIGNPAHQAVIRQYDLEPFELFDSWVETFLGLYEKYAADKYGAGHACEGKPEDAGMAAERKPGDSDMAAERKPLRPNVAIVDILENATLRDFEEFARRFQQAGVNCEICDVRSLVYRDGVLYTPAGNRIDAVYRRAVTADLMKHYGEITAFLDAVREDAVFLAGAFCTQVIHNKWLFYVLHLDRTKQFLTKEECRFVEDHVPLTLEFAPEYISLSEVRKRKDDFIIKPMDAYASNGIYAAGREYTQEDWEKVTGDLYDKKMICQQYCPQYLTDNIDFAWGDGEWHPYINMPGLYVYDGKFAGFLMRMACGEKIIVAHENERTVPVFMVKGKREES